MYSSEIFPQKFREVGMSLAVAVNLSFAGALAMAVPQYQDILSGTDDEQQDSQHNQRNNQHLILLGCFAALDLVAVVLVWFFMRYPDEDVELENMNVCIAQDHFLIEKLTYNCYSRSFLVRQR